MNCKIIAVDGFKRDAKRLSKKYHSLKSDLEALEQILLEKPRSGILITENTYKIRLAVKSKGRGKSGGLRVVTHVIELAVRIKENELTQGITVFLLALFDKSEMENISDHVIQSIIQEINEEFEQEKGDDSLSEDAEDTV